MAEAIDEIPSIDGPERISELVRKGRPVVCRGGASDWPVVTAARAGDDSLLRYLNSFASKEAVDVVEAPAATRGRFHYNSDLTGFNFKRRREPLAAFLAELGALRGQQDASYLAAQGVLAERAAPGFTRANRLASIPSNASAWLWIGNQVQVAIHSDPADNLACVVAGRRRFTLFAPELLPDLAMGPFEPTPAGTPISLADPLAPDFDRFPRFRRALDRACSAILEPGDLLLIPYGWFHHVESLEAINLLVNHWWNDAAQDGGSPWDAMLHAIMAIRHLPEGQRRAWQAMFGHYAFLAAGDPAAHLPPHAAGIHSANTPADRQAMRAALVRALTRPRG